MEHRGNGRFLAYDPKTKTTRTLLRDLSFANGVAVSPDQSFALVVETAKYRVHRVWLSGPKAGQSDIFIDNLPGFPDGITSNGKGKFWLALVTPRDETLDKLLPQPFLRKVVMRLPKFLQPAPKRYSFVLGLDLNGQVTDNLQNGLTRLLRSNCERRRARWLALFRQHRRKHRRPLSSSYAALASRIVRSHLRFPSSKSARRGRILT